MSPGSEEVDDLATIADSAGAQDDEPADAEASAEEDAHAEAEPDEFGFVPVRAEDTARDLDEEPAEGDANVDLAAADGVVEDNLAEAEPVAAVAANTNLH